MKNVILIFCILISPLALGEAFVCKDTESGSIYVVSVEESSESISVGTYNYKNDLLELFSGKFKKNLFGYIAEVPQGKSLVLIKADGAIGLRMNLGFVKASGACVPYA